MSCSIIWKDDGLKLVTITSLCSLHSDRHTKRRQKQKLTACVGNDSSLDNTAASLHRFKQITSQNCLQQRSRRAISFPAADLNAEDNWREITAHLSGADGIKLPTEPSASKESVSAH